MHWRCWGAWRIPGAVLSRVSGGEGRAAEDQEGRVVLNWIAAPWAVKRSSAVHEPGHLRQSGEDQNGSKGEEERRADPKCSEPAEIRLERGSASEDRSRHAEKAQLVGTPTWAGWLTWPSAVTGRQRSGETALEGVGALAGNGGDPRGIAVKLQKLGIPDCWGQ
ncbi:hypothetical protein NDU88_003991 [Pleurodeles waltl]|uniref:Uncharacterized protein n=1 Tax=Pleurodeles waltl TaxID=8319 RepID=A0AAV7QH30_PLEWA|nr:hypothetical protein NDU88_003991 [Pleurodeles waltl]